MFEAVGCELLVNVVMRSWYNLIREINIRMASALKRHGGAAALWLGINHLATLGFVANATDRPECRPHNHRWDVGQGQTDRLRDGLPER